MYCGVVGQIAIGIVIGVATFWPLKWLGEWGCNHVPWLNEPEEPAR